MKQIQINNLLWDTENLKIEGKKHFTHQEALEAAASVGKRLPTEEEFEELLKLPHKWNKERKGIEFENELFFPAMGYINYVGAQYSQEEGKCVCLWTSTIINDWYDSQAYALVGGLNDIAILNGIDIYSKYRYDSFSARLVQDIKK